MTKQSRTRQPFQFEWQVPVDGYKTGEAFGIGDPKTPDLYLYEAHRIGQQRTVGLTRSLRDSSLFLEFARTELTQGGVLYFANKHGALQSNAAIVTLPKESGPQGGEHFPGEKIEFWYSEIGHLKRLIPLWQENHPIVEPNFKTHFAVEPNGIIATWDTPTERGSSPWFCARPIQPSTTGSRRVPLRSHILT